MTKTKEDIKYIFNQMNKSEQFGVRLGLFPQHYVDFYKLDKDDLLALMKVIIKMDYKPLGNRYLRTCKKCGTKWWSKKKNTTCYQCKKRKNTK